MSAPTCSFCSTAAALVPAEGCRVCRACAKRVAELAVAGKGKDVWAMPPPRDADEEMKEAGGRVAAELGGADDADTHYYLAAAYRQMSLYADAVQEAGIATLAAGDDDGKAVAALRLLLTEPLLREDGLAKLGARLARIRSN